MTPPNESPMRKVIVAMMALAVVVIFLTSFISGARIPVEQEAKARQAPQQDPMATVPALMAKLKGNPKDVDAIHELAEIFTRAEDWTKATHFWTKALEISPDNLGLYYHRGYALLQLDRYEESAADYKTILQTKPDSYQAHFYLGFINKHGFSRLDVARQHFEKALALNPDDAELVVEIKRELTDME